MVMMGMTVESETWLRVLSVCKNCVSWVMFLSSSGPQFPLERVCLVLALLKPASCIGCFFFSINIFVVINSLWQLLNSAIDNV